MALKKLEAVQKGKRQRAKRLGLKRGDGQFVTAGCSPPRRQREHNSIQGFFVGSARMIRFSPLLTEASFEEKIALENMSAYMLNGEAV
jgi:hypothetical protein